MTLRYEEQRILIWGKTYPELSYKYIETVCTAGVLEDGRPVRLYPIEYRYLAGDQQFRSYQWIIARIAKSDSDKRPESYKVETDSIRCEDAVSSRNEWEDRAALVFRDPTWQFESYEDGLLRAQESTGRSLGVIEPREIIRVFPRARPGDHAVTFAQKWEELRERIEEEKRQGHLFGDVEVPSLRDLEYIDTRVMVHWRCHGANCNSHHMQILDWGLMELLRREGVEKAVEKAQSILDTDRHSVRFFLGNFAQHPSSFAIVGLWYPRRTDQFRFPFT